MCNSIAYSFRDERNLGQSVPHTKDGQLLFTEVLEKRNGLLPEAVKQGGLKEALMRNSRVSFEHFPNFHESEKFPLKEKW